MFTNPTSLLNQIMLNYLNKYQDISDINNNQTKNKNNQNQMQGPSERILVKGQQVL